MLGTVFYNYTLGINFEVGNGVKTFRQKVFCSHNLWAVNAQVKITSTFFSSESTMLL